LGTLWLATFRGVEGRVGAPGWGLGWMTSRSITHMGLHKPNTSCLMHSWNTFGARTNHGQTQTHKTHHGLNSGEATTFPLIVFSMPSHRANTQVGVPKLLKLGLSQLWRPITLSVNLWLRWGLKKGYSPYRELSNGMWHVTCT
jgi:hypothetical protein